MKDPQYLRDRRGGYQGNMSTLRIFVFLRSLFVYVLAMCNGQNHIKLTLLPMEHLSEECSLLHHNLFVNNWEKNQTL